MKTLGSLILLLSLVNPAAGQDSHIWGSLSQLKSGDRVRVSLAAGRALDGDFQNWTPEQITVGTVSTQKADVRKVERYRPGGSHRGKSAAIGAGIGFGGGLALGAAAGGCSQHDILCFSRGEAAVIVGAAGAVIGAAAGALIPRSSKTLIYATK